MVRKQDESHLCFCYGTWVLFNNTGRRREAGPTAGSEFVYVVGGRACPDCGAGEDGLLYYVLGNKWVV